MTQDKHDRTDITEEQPRVAEQNDQDDVEFEGEELEERIAPAQVGLPIGRPAS